MIQFEPYEPTPVCGVARSKSGKVTCELPLGHKGNFNLDIGLAYTGHMGRGQTGRWYSWTVVKDEIYYVDGVAYYADLPVHLSIGVNEDGDGPVDENDPDYFEQYAGVEITDARSTRYEVCNCQY